MGFDNDCILNIQSLAGEYFCPVCHLLVYPNEALQAPCTHLYCKPCLTYVVSTTHACPYDGYRVTEADCKPLLESNKTLADTIGKIQVHCLYYRTGCTWQGPLSDCISHCSTCSFGESPVLCNRCGVQIVHRQVQEHAQSCPGVQSQAQQPSNAQDGTTTGAVADQAQTAAQAVLPASQAQTSQASASLASGQDNQTASTAGQPQAAQAAMPTAEQWYQQQQQQQQQYQQQYQQYYQQYPGYDPYQQNYQYYYQYQQGAQQYPQQPSQGYPPQAYGQAQTQISGQAQAQPQLQAQQQAQPQPQQQTQPQQQPQAPSQIVQPSVQTNFQPSASVQSQVQPVGQAQPQMQVQGQAPPSHTLPYNQSQPLPQAQPYAQPQPITQQQTPVPQYQQTHPHAQSYPPSQTQTQHYPYTQPQPHSQPIMQAPAHPTSQQNQPMNPNSQPQTQSAVTGYQSYPQPQPHPQAQVGVAHPVHASGAQPQPQYPGQIQGKLPSQPSQMYSSQPYSNVAAQQQPTMSSAQVQPPSGPPSQQLPVYPHSQQPGYPFQHRPGVQAAQQAAPQQFGQQQPFPGHGLFTQPQPQPQPPMAAQLHAQGPPQMLQHSQQNYAPGYIAQPNIVQNYAARPVTAQGAGSQPHLQAAGAGQVRLPHLNQAYPLRTDSQLSTASEHKAGHPQQFPKATGGEKPRDQNDPNKESGAGVQVIENKLKSENALDGNGNENESKLAATGSNLLGSDNQEHKQRMKGDASEDASEFSNGNNTTNIGSDTHKDARKKAEVQELKHAAKSAGDAAAAVSNMPHSHLNSQVHGTNSFPAVDQGRNQMQSMQYGPSAQHRPGAASMPQSTPQLSISQQPGLGSQPGQLRPQGPGQAPPRPPFNAADIPQTSIPKHPHGLTPHEIASGGNLGPASSGPFVRPGNMGYHQGNMPPYQAGQPHNLPGEPFVGVGGRERADAEQRPPYMMENEKFQAHRPGYFDGRKPDSLPHGSMDRAPYGPAHPGIQLGAMKFPEERGMRDERGKMFPEERLKPFPHRDFEDDSRKFPRPSHFEAGPSSKYGTHLPSSRPLDHGSHMFGGDGMPRPFDRAPHGLNHDSGLKRDSGVGSGPSRFLPPFHLNDAGERSRAAGFPDDDMGRGDFGHRPDFPGPAPGPGFGRPRMDGFPPRSPCRDFPGFPSRTFGAFGDDVGNESRPFEGSRPYNFPAEPFGKSMHENRFPIPPNHVQRGELSDHLAGGPRNPDMLPNHLRREHMGPRNMHMGEGIAFGLPGGHSRMGEPPLAGNFPRHLPFGESFGGEKPGHPLVGEHGFRGSSGFNRYGRDGGFFPEEMDPFDNPRKRKPGSIMCRICKVECGTVEGLDLHSQSREHQRKARDMVLSIKQSNKKKQKISKDQGSIEGRDAGRPKNFSFQGRGNKR